MLVFKRQRPLVVAEEAEEMFDSILVFIKFQLYVQDTFLPLLSLTDLLKPKDIQFNYVLSQRKQVNIHI